MFWQWCITDIPASPPQIIVHTSKHGSSGMLGLDHFLHLHNVEEGYWMNAIIHVRVLQDERSLYDY